MKRTHYSPIPATTATPLVAALTTRGRPAVVAAQQETWLLIERLIAVDPELRAELERARAGEQAPITSDKETIVRACVAGALNPDEAVTLFRRAQG